MEVWAQILLGVGVPTVTLGGLMYAQLQVLRDGQRDLKELLHQHDKMINEHNTRLALVERQVGP